MTDTAPFAFGLLVLGCLGLVVGSFLNVVIHRVPLGESIVRPGSACPGCGSAITPRDNIPVVSWLILRGRCRHCGEPISVRYPLVELLNAAVWVALALWAWRPEGGIDPLLPLLLVLSSACLALLFIDLEHYRLPDAIVLPLYPVTVIGLAWAGVVDGSWPLVDTTVGVVAWLGLIGGIWLLSRGRGMGFGDVKLAPVLGATLGWVAMSATVVGLVVAFVVGAVVGLGLMIVGRAGRKTHLPFGPFLIVGAGIGLVAGQSLGDWYLSAID